MTGIIELKILVEFVVLLQICRRCALNSWFAVIRPRSRIVTR